MNIDTTLVTPGKDKEAANLISRNSDKKRSTADEAELESLSGDDPELKEKDFRYLALQIFRKETNTLVNEVEKFFEECGVSTWPLVFGLTGSELVTAVQFPADSSLRKPIFNQRLMKILDFVALTGQSFASPLTYDDVNAKLQEFASKSSAASSYRSSSGGNSISDIKLKVQMPKIEAFSGDAEDFYYWKKKMKHAFGAETLRGVTDDPTFHKMNAAVSEAAFSAIANALAGGTANSTAEDLLASGDVSAYNLVQALDKEYNTESNRNNFIVTAVMALVELKLDHTTTVGNFIEDYKQIIRDLEANGTATKPLYPVLRAFLIRSVSSEEFQNEQSWIVDNPGKDLSDYLARLRLREDNQRITDGHSVRPDTNKPSSILRRGSTAQYQKRNAHFEKSDAKAWNIPPIPRTWIKMMNKGALSFIDEWRAMANKTHIGAQKLVSMFEIKSSDPNWNGGGQRSRGRGRSRSARRTTANNGQNDDANGDEDDGSTRPNKQIRIMLNSPRLTRRGEVIPSSVNRTITTFNV